jgi:hypothetical protein
MEVEVSENAVTKLVHFNNNNNNNNNIIILQCYFRTVICVRLFAEGIAHMLGISYLELHRLLSFYEI